MSHPHKIEITGDGSPTIRSGIYDAEYHSKHGAVRESLHVFIEAGLNFLIADRAPQEISLLEYGFGTGLNAYYTAEQCEKGPLVRYETLELHPLDAITTDLFAEQLSGSKSHSFNPTLFSDLHRADWEKKVCIHPRFYLSKKKCDFRQYRASGTYDLVYYDAFGPGTQADLWTKDIFGPLSEAVKSGGVLVTYCVQGAFRRMLSTLGFECEKLPGPPGKREMLRAVKV